MRRSTPTTAVLATFVMLVLGACRSYDGPPAEPAAVTPVPEHSAPQRADRSGRLAVEAPVSVPTSVPPAVAPQPQTHAVEHGQSLADLQRLYGVDWRRIYDANPSISDQDHRLWLHPGQKIRIPAADEVVPQRPMPVPRAVVRASRSEPRTAPSPPEPATTAPTPGVSGSEISPEQREANRQLAHQLILEYWGEDQLPCIDQLWGTNLEASWNHLKWNGRGSGAYGIPQALPGSKMASHGPDWLTSARTQILWGRDYIRDRPDYGTPCRALQERLRKGWY